MAATRSITPPNTATLRTHHKGEKKATTLTQNTRRTRTWSASESLRVGPQRRSWRHERTAAAAPPPQPQGSLAQAERTAFLCERLQCRAQRRSSSAAAAECQRRSSSPPTRCACSQRLPGRCWRRAAQRRCTCARSMHAMALVFLYTSEMAIQIDHLQRPARDTHKEV